MHVKKIVVGYDGTDYSKQALRKAEEIAHQGGSRIIIVNIYRKMITKSFSEKLLREAEESLATGLEVETVSARNTDVAEEVEIAERIGADLLVVGSSSMGELIRSYWTV